MPIYTLCHICTPPATGRLRCAPFLFFSLFPPGFGFEYRFYIGFFEAGPSGLVRKLNWVVYQKPECCAVALELQTLVGGDIRWMKSDRVGPNKAWSWTLNGILDSAVIVTPSQPAHLGLVVIAVCLVTIQIPQTSSHNLLHHPAVKFHDHCSPFLEPSPQYHRSSTKSKCNTHSDHIINLERTYVFEILPQSNPFTFKPAPLQRFV